MNFLLLRSSQLAVPELRRISEIEPNKDDMGQPSTTLEGLIGENPLRTCASREDVNDSDDGEAAHLASKDRVPVGFHTDVTEDEGWIIIPSKELPDNWNDIPDMVQLRSLDRSFIFPGEQVHLLVCLSASKQDKEIITPFRVAAAMSKNGMSGQNGKRKFKTLPDKSSTFSENGVVNGVHDEAAGTESNGERLSTAVDMAPKQDVPEPESLLQMEVHKQKTEVILERFRNSNFFVRIAESDEPLWSNKKLAKLSSVSPEILGERSGLKNHECEMVSRAGCYNAIADKGFFDGAKSGGAARDAFTCFSLDNGDIVVLLRVNVGVSSNKDPVIEVLQFEKSPPIQPASENVCDTLKNNEDPCRELLSWLLPLDHTLPPSRSLAPPLSSTISHKPSYSASGSQIFSFSHFRSYSMPSLPQNSALPSSVLHSSSSKPAFDLEQYDNFAPEKPTNSSDVENEGNFSFRGVLLEPERYSVRCGLQGVYSPGKRWRRKVEIIQPIEVHSFAARGDTQNLLCVQVKNVAPLHVSDMIIFLDAITIVSEEASKVDVPLSLPIASVEPGNGHSLPNLSLRRGEEHSFILKPATMSYRGLEDHYAFLVSYHCNYSESKLFFKQATSWRPFVARDLLISISSEPYKQAVGPSTRVPQLPVQVLTLQATNMTHEDLNLTVLAPEPSTSFPSVLSLDSTEMNTGNGYNGSNEHIVGTSGDNKHATSIRRLSSFPNDSRNGGWSAANKLGNASDCTHLWLQSAVPLGCVPACSSTTVKLELLPLTDGIITLDTLQITIKEKGLTYIPEHSLKIFATSSISTGVS